MKSVFLRKHTAVAACCFSLLITACKGSYFVSGAVGTAIPMTAQYDRGHTSMNVLVDSYRERVDSIMSPVVGHSAGNYARYRPESPMSNLMADILFWGAAEKSGTPVDLSIMNMGGIRSDLSKGTITYGDIFEIAPFENKLCIATMNGHTLQKLLSQVAAVGGEGVSHVKLALKDKTLVSAEVNGKEIDPNRIYRVATIDYLAEGNDKMTAFLDSNLVEFPENITLRQLFFEYVRSLEKAGKEVSAAIEGRIVVL